MSKPKNLVDKPLVRKLKIEKKALSPGGYAAATWTGLTGWIGSLLSGVVGK